MGPCSRLMQHSHSFHFCRGVTSLLRAKVCAVDATDREVLLDRTTSGRREHAVGYHDSCPSGLMQTAHINALRCTFHDNQSEVDITQVR